MEHWFDDLTRRFSQQPLTRRGMVSLSAKIAAAVAGAGLLGRNPAEVSAAEVAATPAALGVRQAAQGASACTVDDSYGLLRTEFSTSLAGSPVPLTLSHVFTAQVANGATRSVLTLKSGEEIVRRTSTVALANGIASVSTIHGARYVGIKRAIFTTDGRTVEGAVDGRQTEVVPLSADPTGLRFKDGRPAPVAQTSPGLDKAVNDLLAQAATQSVTCQPDSKAPKPIATCTQSQLDCRQAWVRCSLKAAQASLAYGPLASAYQLKTANADCDAALQTCYQSAKSSGACCPDFCNGDPKCCQTAWGCCPTAGQSTVDGQPTSKDWPTCPRCGPVTAAVTPRGAPRTARKPGPNAAPKP